MRALGDIFPWVMLIVVLIWLGVALLVIRGEGRKLQAKRREIERERERLREFL